MQYISGRYALNLPCALATAGDWHPASLDWTHIPLLTSEESFYHDYGIEWHDAPPTGAGTCFVANHIRACLDMLLAGDFSNLQGMRSDFICTDQYDDELFQKIYMLRNHPQWSEIDRFIEKEYMMKWLRWKEHQHGSATT